VLARIAPLTAVRGNNDRGAWARRLPIRATLDVGGVRIHVIHDVHELDLDRSGPVDVVVAGHSHRPEIVERDGVLFVNPGSAGPRRFRLPIAVARIAIRSGAISAEIVPIAASAPVADGARTTAAARRGGRVETSAEGVEMKVLLIHPSPVMHSEIYLRLEPLGIERVAQAIRSAGHEVRLSICRSSPRSRARRGRRARAGRGRLLARLPGEHAGSDRSRPRGEAPYPGTET
jgi:hypothetical protein